ncbi:MAG: hypothetical protein RSD82_12880 [Comamonas sp.]
MNCPPFGSACAGRRASPIARHCQQGFSLFFSLIALVILLVAAVSVMQSSGLSLFTSGNAAFKQDIQARAEKVNLRIFALLRPGGALEGEEDLANSSKANNYSAVVLDVNDQGIPLALINDNSFAAVGEIDNDIKDEVSNTSIRYVMERLCSKSGKSGILQSEYCVNSDLDPILGGSSPEKPLPIFSPAYRVSIKIQGPRGSEAYLQSTFAKPN